MAVGTFILSPSEKSQHRLGVFQIILSGICFGSLGLFGKKAYSLGFSSGELLGLRYLCSAILLGTLVFLFSRSRFQLGLRTILISIALGVFGYALFSSLYFLALEKISASLTVLLLYTYPIIISLLNYFFLKIKMTRNAWLSLIITCTGLFLLVQSQFQISQPVYILFGLGSALFYALYIIVSHRLLKNTDAIGSSFYVQLGAGVTLCLLHFDNINRPIKLLSQHSLLIVSMAVICSLLAMTLFLMGLQKVSSHQASILSTTEPISAVILAMLFLGESLSTIQIIGSLFIIGGMLLVGKKSPANA